MIKITMLFLAVALWASGCSGTKVKDEWRDPGYGGPGLRSVVVLVLPPDLEGNRTADEFVKQLGGRGVSAVPGYQAMPGSAASREAVLAKARELGFEMVLVSSYLDKRRELAIYPRQSQSMILMPDFEMWPNYELVENEYLVFATVLYDAVTGKPVWSSVSDTFVRGSERKNAKSYVKAVLKKMERQRLVGKGR